MYTINFVIYSAVEVPAQASSCPSTSPRVSGTPSPPPVAAKASVPVPSSAAASPKPPGVSGNALVELALRRQHLQQMFFGFIPDRGNLEPTV